MKTKLFTLLLLIVSACSAEMGDEAQQGAAGSVGVDKEALTVTTQLGTWPGISTEPQALQALNCFASGFSLYKTSSRTCSIITATNNLGARCLFTSGPRNGTEIRIVFSGNPETGTLLTNGSPGGTVFNPSNFLFSYIPTPTWPKQYFYDGHSTDSQYSCVVQCVPGSNCAGLQVLWTEPRPK